MTRPAGRAAIEIVGDPSKFAPQLQRDADRALSQVHLNTGPLTNQIADGLEKGVEQGGKAFHELPDDARTAFRSILSQAGSTFANVAEDARAAGVAIEAALRSDNLGRIIGNDVQAGRLPAVTAGVQIGEAASDALDTAFAIGVQGTGGHAARAIATDAVINLDAARPELVAAGAAAGEAVGRGFKVAATEGITSGVVGASAAGEAIGIAAADGVAATEGRFRHTLSRFGALAQTAFLGVAAALGAGLVAATGFGLKTAATLEQVQIQFESLTGSAAAGLQQFKDLQQFAAATPFEFNDLTTAAARFDAFSGSVGLSQKALIPFLTTVGNVVSVTGGGAQALDSVSLALGQIASRGKVTLDNINQLSNAMPGFSGVAAIAAAEGTTQAKAMDMITAGTLTAKQGIADLIVGMQKFPGAAGAMARQSETLLGVFSTFHDTVGQALSGAFAPVIPEIKKSLAQVTPIIGDTLKVLAPALGAIVAQLLPFLTGLLQGLTPILVPVLAALRVGLATLTPALAPLGEALGNVAAALLPLAAPLSKIIAALATGLAPVLAGLTPALAGVAAGVSSIAPLAPVLANLGEALGGALVPAAQAAGTLLAQLAPIASRLIASLGTSLTPVLFILGDALGQVLVAVTPLITELVSALEPILLKVGPAFADVVAALSPLIPAVLQLLPPLLQLVEAFLPLLNLIPPLLPVITTLANLLATVLAGAVGLLAGQLANMIQFFEDTPGALAAAGIALGAWVIITKGATIAAGLQARATTAMASAQSTLSGALERTKGGATRAALALTALAIAGQALDSLGNRTTDTQGLSDALLRLGKTGEFTGELTNLFGKNLAGVQDDALAATGGINNFNRSVENVVPGMSALDRLFIGRSFTDAATHFQQVDDALAGMVRDGHADAARGAFVAITQASHQSADTIEALTPKYVNALTEVDKATKQTADSTVFAKQAADSLLDSWDRLNGQAQTVDQAMLDARHAVDGVTEAFKEGSKAVAGNSTAALENRVALRDAAKAAEAAAAAYLNNGGTAAGAAKIITDFKVAAEKATGATGAQKTAVDKLADSLFALPDHVNPTVTVKVFGLAELQAMNANLQAALSRSGQVKFDATKQADGGIVRFFASGGLEQHIAQVVPPGRVRIWNEPEAGGEAYIPLSASKRTRSLQVLKTVAADFGFALMPGGVSMSSMAALSGASTRLTDLIAGSTRPPTPTAQGAPPMTVHVRVFVGDREITDIVRVEIDEHDRQLKRKVGAR